jgi:hypothetical protein
MIIRSRKEIDMEQHNPQSSGSPHEAAQPIPEDEHAALFDYVASAIEDIAPIDDAAARAMALLLHDGEGSALHELVRTGGIADVAGLHAEIAVWRQEGPAGLDAWLDALSRYVDHREDRGPLVGWQSLRSARSPPRQLLQVAAPRL